MTDTRLWTSEGWDREALARALYEEHVAAKTAVGWGGEYSVGWDEVIADEDNADMIRYYTLQALALAARIAREDAWRIGVHVLAVVEEARDER